MSDKILLVQSYRQPQPPVLNQRHTDRNRRWFLVARIGTLAFTLLALGLFLFSLPAYYAQLRTPCSDSLSICPNSQLTVGLALAVQHAGLSLSAYAALMTIITILSALICIPVAILLLWSRSTNWMALLVAVFLVFTGTVNPMPIRFLGKEPTLATILHLLYWLLAFTSLTLVFLLFPNGRFVPRRTRWIIMTIAILSILIGIIALPSHSKVFDLISDIIWITFYITAIVAQVYRYWRVSTSIERQQTKMVLFVLTWFLLYLLVTSSLQLLFPSLWHSDSLFTLITNNIGSSFFPLLFSLALGLAVLRYRLYDVDLLINRTLVYGSLTTILLLIYLLLVFVGQHLLVSFIGRNDAAVLVVSTLVVAALFQPLRHHIQQLIDRRFYRRKYDAAKVVAAFSSTLRNEVDLPTLSEHLLAVVQETMQPTHVSLWLVQRGPMVGGSNER
jgi:hypothetical protein